MSKDHDWPGYIKEHFPEIPFWRFLNAEVVETARGYGKLRLPTKREYGNDYGILHGALTAAAVDMAAGLCLRTLGVRTVTVETQTTYFAGAALGEDLFAEGRCTREGRSLLHAAVEVKSPDGKLLATGKAIYFVLGEDFVQEPA